jgi:hypothetical protein
MKIIISGNDLDDLSNKIINDMRKGEGRNPVESTAFGIINITAFMDETCLPQWQDCDYVINKIGDELQVALYWGDILLRQSKQLAQDIDYFFEPCRYPTQAAHESVMKAAEYFTSTPIDEMVIPVAIQCGGRDV